VRKGKKTLEKPTKEKMNSLYEHPERHRTVEYEKNQEDQGEEGGSRAGRAGTLDTRLMPKMTWTRRNLAHLKSGPIALRHEKKGGGLRGALQPSSIFAASRASPFLRGKRKSTLPERMKKRESARLAFRHA